MFATIQVIALLFISTLFLTATIFMAPVFALVNGSDESKIWHLLAIPAWLFGMFLYMVFPPLYFIIVVILWFVCMTTATLETIICFFIGLVFNYLVMGA